MRAARTFPLRTAALCIRVTVLLWVLAGGATSWGAVVEVSGTQLVIDASEAENHVLDVRVIGMAFVIDETAAPITAMAGCGNLEAHRAICGAMPVDEVRVLGGPGNDFIALWDLNLKTAVDGGEGDDLIEAGPGRDELKGGGGIDTLVGGDEEDQLVGDEGDDLLEGEGGADELIAGDGDDILSGGDSSGDVLHGDAGQDLLRSGTGGAQLDGGDGDDVLLSGTGEDVLDPGTGQDTILGVNVSEDTVRCRRGDLARSGSGDRVDGCGRVPGSKVAPKAWPPVSATTAVTGLPRFDPATIVKPRIRGDATRFSVRVEAKRSGTTWICVRLYDSNRVRVGRFSAEVRKKHAKTYYVPHISRSSYYGRPYRGRCR